MKDSVHAYLFGEFGDEDVVREIYAEYRSSTSAKIDESARALEVQDFLLLDRAAHALKGTALMVGDEEALAAALALRDAAKAQDADAARNALASVRRVFDVGGAE